ncbi:EsaB/YukD family protein [Virgibacillus sp. YIM 98842]|uniref:EsaB/YukD family protein n=1 Tax=Virgibacillus sp. YIM 98842 TaxID=2663533 RepID=UPI0013DBF259|nr:EsaB/YukD family protein [Virgibacillus sp. YIM 98842]
MSQNTHINVTVDFSKRIPNGMQYDLRIPVQLTVKQLLQYVMDTLRVDYSSNSKFVIKVITKNLLISDDDYLTDYPVTDGDVLHIL